LLDEWVEKWQTLIVPLRREFGFEIPGAWVDRKHNQFIWISRIPGHRVSLTVMPSIGLRRKRKDPDLDPHDYLMTTDVRDVEPIL
jgi:hypothetical protein